MRERVVYLDANDVKCNNRHETVASNMQILLYKKNRDRVDSDGNVNIEYVKEIVEDIYRHSKDKGLSFEDAIEDLALHKHWKEVGE